MANYLLSLQGVRSMVVTGPEPGAGCSSVCLGLGAAIAGLGHRAAVVDCNLNRPQLHQLLGEPNFVGLTNSLEGDRSLESSGITLSPELLVVPTGPVPPDPVARLRSRQLVETIRELENTREVVLLDAPVASRVLEYPTLSEGFDGVLLVVHAARSSKSSARAATDDLLEAEINLLGVILNGAS